MCRAWLEHVKNTSTLLSHSITHSVCTQLFLFSTCFPPLLSFHFHSGVFRSVVLLCLGFFFLFSHVACFLFDYSISLSDYNLLSPTSGVVFLVLSLAISHGDLGEIIEPAMETNSSKYIWLQKTVPQNEFTVARKVWWSLWNFLDLWVNYLLNVVWSSSKSE